MKITELKPNNANPRTIKDDKFRKLVASIQDFPKMMALRPIVIDADGTILGGNMRYRALVELGYNEIPDTWVKRASDLTDEEKRRFIIEDNVPFGQWDWDALGNDWDAVELEDWGLDVWQPMDEQEPEEKPVEVVEDEFNEDKEIETRCKKGDIWQLGEHRLMCGDSTEREALGKLMGDNIADLVFADPPYGMGKEKEGVINDNLNFDKLLEFNREWIGLSFTFLKANGSWYCWGVDEPLMDIYANILKPMQREGRITFRNLITWNKGDAGAGGVSFMGKDGLRSYPIADEKCLFVMCGVQGFNNNADNYFEGWEPIRSYLAEEAKKAGIDAKTLKDICGVGMFSHWFTKSQWAFIPEEHYRKIQDYCREKHKETFQKDYEALKKEWYKTRAYFDNTHDTMTDVWEFGRVKGAERASCGGHATPKPIALCGRAILSSSRKGELILDPFGGSGSTLIAAEQTQRRCYAMEIDPHYCDVIMQRWEEFTGKKAEKVQPTS